MDRNVRQSLHIAFGTGMERARHPGDAPAHQERSRSSLIRSQRRHDAECHPFRRRASLSHRLGPDSAGLGLYRYGQGDPKHDPVQSRVHPIVSDRVRTTPAIRQGCTKNHRRPLCAPARSLVRFPFPFPRRQPANAAYDRPDVAGAGKGGGVYGCVGGVSFRYSLSVKYSQKNGAASSGRIGLNHSSSPRSSMTSSTIINKLTPVEYRSQLVSWSFFRCPLNGVLPKVSEALFCQRISKLSFEITSERILGGTLQMNIA